MRVTPLPPTSTFLPPTLILIENPVITFYRLLKKTLTVRILKKKIIPKNISALTCPDIVPIRIIRSEFLAFGRFYQVNPFWYLQLATPNQKIGKLQWSLTITVVFLLFHTYQTSVIHVHIKFVCYMSI